MINVPWLVYGGWDPVTRLGGTEIRFSHPQLPWGKATVTQGGYEKSGAGIAETWTQYRERHLIFRPVVSEAELLALEAFVDWAQDNAGGPFLFGYDLALTRDALRECYLESPMQGTSFTPERSTSPGYWTATLTLRSADGAPWVITPFPGV